MPFKIPFTPLVVTGHRGYAITDRDASPLVQRLAGQKKDHYGLAPRAAGDGRLLPLPRAGKGLRAHLPTLSIKRVTDYTRYPNDQAVAKAVDRMAVNVAFPEEVVGQVKRHVAARLGELDALTNRTPAPLILLGAVPGSNVSLISALTTIASVQGRGATVLMDMPAADVAAGLSLDGFEALCRSQPATAGSMSRLAMQDPARRESMAGKLIAYAARAAGAKVGSLNERKHDALHLGEHETAIEETVKHHYDGAQGPVVVIVAPRHLPWLHDHAETDVVAIATLGDDDVAPPTSHHRKRTSYLLANDGILKIRCSEQVDNASIDMLALADQLVRQPGAQTADTARYGIEGPSTGR
jgi:hypothetical protein